MFPQAKEEMEVVLQVERIGWAEVEKHKEAWCVKVTEKGKLVTVTVRDDSGGVSWEGGRA